MARIVPFTEARGELSSLVDEVVGRREHVVITRSGRPAAVLLSADEYESLQETLDVLADEELVGALRESEADVRAGRLESLEDVKRRLGRA